MNDTTLPASPNTNSSFVDDRKVRRRPKPCEIAFAQTAEYPSCSLTRGFDRRTGQRRGARAGADDVTRTVSRLMFPVPRRSGWVASSLLS